MGWQSSDVTVVQQRKQRMKQTIQYLKHIVPTMLVVIYMLILVLSHFCTYSSTSYPFKISNLSSK